MIAARVAGVPMPESFIASRSSSSSTSLARGLHRAQQRRVGVAPRRLGLLLQRTRPRACRTSSSRSSAGSCCGRALVVLVLRRPSPLGLGLLAVDAAPARHDEDPCRACGRRARRPSSPRACSRRRPRGGRRRGSAGRPGRRSRRSSSLILSSVCGEFVGMIAWWSPTLASSTTRPSGSRSRPVTYSAAGRVLAVGRRRARRVGLISATMSRRAGSASSCADR